MKIPFPRFVRLFGFLVLTFPLLAFGQCSTQLTHGSGTLLVGGSNITVTPAGMTSLYNSYCPSSTSPYMIGYSFCCGGSGSGGFLFNFSPPVSGVTLNFSGASDAGTSIEEIRLFVNGAHYAMSSVGTNNSCDAMAVLTGAGDLRGCPGCGVSGWSGTSIAGPITSLRVDDVVVSGTPNGALFSLFSCGVVLPVEWMNFDASANANGGVDLNWSTANEINSSHFEVQRSVDGMNWEAIGEVPARGNSTERSDYAFVDAQPLGGLLHYRIQELNLDGAGTFTEVRELRMPVNGVTIFPNPAERMVNVSFENAGLNGLVLRNALGQELQCPMELQASGAILDLAQLQAGIYFLEVNAHGRKSIHKLQLR